jgi:nitrite reductase/ring-hydroxylating ferredoxin subunit
MTRTHVVAAADDLPEGERLIVEVGGRSIGIFNVDGELYAVRNRCPHQGAELCRGKVLSGISAPAPGQFVFDREHKYLACPWHGWEFDLETGQSYWDPAHARVRAYDVTTAKGADLYAPATDDPTSRVPGPYVAETVEVFSDGEYIVVSL